MTLEHHPTTRTWSARKPLILGFLALLALLGGVGVWSIATTISGAIIASGEIQVESYRQVVQHPDGGVVGLINVDDGDLVSAGDVLIRLDDTKLQSELTILESQLFEVLARRARLEAERDGSLDPVFSDDLTIELEAHPEVQTIMDGQRRLFMARNISLTKEEEQLAERKIQINDQIAGASAQLNALKTQIDLIGQELKDQKSLLDKGLAQAGRVLALQREEARLQGMVGELEAGIAQSRGRITEIEIEVLKLVSTRREEAITNLRDLQNSEAELRERRLSVKETLSRLDVRAPASGIVYGKQVHALRSVIRPADPVMYIVPQDSPLVINARVAAIHVDQVFVGQKATLRFASFDQRTTPELFGKVSKLSADVFKDDVTGQSFYAAEITPLDQELEKLGDLELIPGMPVEAFIKTRDRSPLTYLVKPMMDYFNRSFRES